MKHLPKLLSALTGAAVLTAALSTAAFAALPVQESAVQFTKTIHLTDAAAVSPAGTVLFTVEPGAAGQEADAKPGLAEHLQSRTVQAVFAGGTAGDAAATADVGLVLTQFTAPGLYYYTVTEQDAGVAGLDTAAEPQVLKVRIVNADPENPDGKTFAVDSAVLVGADGAKTEGFVNTYTTHTLTLQKQVRGTFADRDRAFDFTVELTDPDDTPHIAAVNVTVNGESRRVDFADGKASFTQSIRPGEDVVISGLPAGTRYTVTETGADDYTTAWSNDPENTAKTSADNVMPDADAALTVTNTKNATPPTGLTDNPAAYAGLLALGAVGTVALRRRKN
ncbi:DUF5979 domain-containing protein [uncultured Gemmiger sp.]|uniref:DUF7601 domain-containing protein n=1 Tax=uncultured Gemmiger sp. TaxID=1623490 RepID=UPI0025FF3FE1|nr:DUF5979 domain-containing protein [uncultured Gemmiger sp.]